MHAQLGTSSKLKIGANIKHWLNILDKNSNLEVGTKNADTIIDKTKRTFKNGQVLVILSILVQFYFVVGILSNCT